MRLKRNPIPPAGVVIGPLPEELHDKISANDDLDWFKGPLTTAARAMGFRRIGFDVACFTELKRL